MSEFFKSFNEFMNSRIDKACSDDFTKHPEVGDIIGKIEKTDRKTYKAIMDYIDSVSERVYRQGLKDGAALTRELLGQ